MRSDGTESNLQTQLAALVSKLLNIEFGLRCSPIAVSLVGTHSQSFSQGDLLTGNNAGSLTALSLGTDSHAHVADNNLKVQE